MPICEHCQNALGIRTVDLAMCAEIAGKEYIFTKRILVCDSCKRKLRKASNKIAEQRLGELELEQSLMGGSNL